jgi:hypothetical protein
MRRAPAPIEPAATLHVELAERLRVTAARLEAMPADAATSLSITTGWQGRTEADVRAMAATVAKTGGFRPVISAHGDSVTVTFQRSERRHR